MHTHVHDHTHTRMYAFTRLCINTHKYIFVGTCMQVCVYMHSNIHMRTCVCTCYTRIGTYIDTYVQICIHICEHVSYHKDCLAQRGHTSRYGLQRIIASQIARAANAATVSSPLVFPGAETRPSRTHLTPHPQFERPLKHHRLETHLRN